MSDFGATDQFSLQRFDKPLTTSALLPMRRRRPMTFLRHVPILRAATATTSSQSRADEESRTEKERRGRTAAACRSARPP